MRRVLPFVALALVCAGLAIAAAASGGGDDDGSRSAAPAHLELHGEVRFPGGHHGRRGG